MAWTDTTGFETVWGDPTTGWMVIVIMTSITIITFYGLVFMLARAFKIEQVEKAAVSETFQAMFSLLLAFMIVWILTFTFEFIMTEITGGGSTITCDAYGKIAINGAGPIEAMKCRLMEKAALLSDLYEKMYYAAREPFNDFYVSWGLLGIPMYYQGSYVWQSEPSELYYEVEAYRFLNSIIVTLLIGINAYLAAVDYVANTMLPLFLPIGLVLRAIPFTRGVGAFFIALAIGLYIVYPMLFFITDPTFLKSDSPYMDITQDQVTWPWPSFRGAVALATLGPQSHSATQAFSITNIKDAAADLSRLYYFFIIHPIVILSITLVIMRYLTYLFGGEGQELYRLALKVL